MSGMLATLLRGRSVESLVPGPGGDRLVQLSVADLRALGMEIELAPMDDEPAHVHIVGAKPRVVRKKIAALARYRV